MDHQVLFPRLRDTTTQNESRMAQQSQSVGHGAERLEQIAIMRRREDRMVEFGVDEDESFRVILGGELTRSNVKDLLNLGSRGVPRGEARAEAFKGFANGV
jgi:hypothetical protein